MDKALDSFFSPGTPQSPSTPFTPDSKDNSFASTSNFDAVHSSPDIPDLVAQSSPQVPQNKCTTHIDPAVSSAGALGAAEACAESSLRAGSELSPHGDDGAGVTPLQVVSEQKALAELQNDLCERTCLSSFAGLSTSERRPAGSPKNRDPNTEEDSLGSNSSSSVALKSTASTVAGPTDGADQSTTSRSTAPVFFFHAKPRLNQFVGLISYLLELGRLHTTGRALLPVTAEDTAKREQFVCYPVLEALAEAATLVLKKEPNMLEINVEEDEELVVVGDIHGQFIDMYCHVITQQTEEESNPEQVDKRFLFLGDLVDRGPFSVEVSMLVLALKVEFPELVHLTRGNHEESKTSRVYGFLTESQAKFGDKGTWAWDKMNQAFRHIPLCAIVHTPKMRFFATHGGISPALHDDVSTIAKVDRAAYCYTLKGEQEDLVNGLLWSDPTVEVGTYTRNPRGCGVQFGRLATDTFCSHNNVDFICRAHQVVMDGYCWQHRDRIVTVFSAPNYCGINDNLGAIMVVKGNVKKPSFIQYEAFEADEDDCAAPSPDGNFAYAACFQ